MIRLSLGLQIGAAMVLGLLAGLAARALPDGNGLVVMLDLLGSSFVQLLKVLVPPLVFASIVASIGNLRALSNASRLVTQTLLWFAITGLIAVAVGIAIALLVQPGVGAAPDLAAATRPRTIGTWMDFLKGLIPANVLGLTVSTSVKDGVAVSVPGFNVLQIVVIAVLAGVAALKVGEAGEPFMAFARSLLAVVRKLLAWLIALSPIGAFGLLGNAVATYGWDSLARLGWFAGSVYLGLAVVVLGIYPALLLLHGLSPARCFRAALPAMQIGFVTRSSIGTLPATEEAVERLGVARGYASFAVPVAATTKMDGCAAIYPGIAAIFIAQFYGLALGPTDYAALVLVSVVGSAATAGMTGALVMLTLALSTLGLPLEGAGLLLAIDPILDMGRTAVNVAGQIVVTYVVAHREGLLDKEQAETALAPAE